MDIYDCCKKKENREAISWSMVNSKPRFDQQVPKGTVKMHICFAQRSLIEHSPREIFYQPTKAKTKHYLFIY
jgi:hypothetical protein